MIETVLAVLFITFVFIVFFTLSHTLTAKILAEHAAARAARARSVGLNDFMCLKSARVALIPVAGKRLWPEEEEGDDVSFEISRIPIYLSTEHEALARGVLEYELWNSLGWQFRSGGGIAPEVSAQLRLKSDWFDVNGDFTEESHFPFYLEGE